MTASFTTSIDGRFWRMMFVAWAGELLGAARGLYPLRVASNRILDLRDRDATAYFGIDTKHRTVEWQDIRATGAPSPTWVISDRIRSIGMDGMLYASRTQPHLTHLTLLNWNTGTSATVRPDGDGQAWS